MAFHVDVTYEVQCSKYIIPQVPILELSAVVW